MPTTNAEVETSKLVYEQSTRAIDKQVQQLDELRGRAAAVLAASGITAGFFATTALKDGTGPAAVCAILAFTIGAIFCVAALVPKFGDWTFVISAQLLIPDFLKEGDVAPPEKLYAHLASYIEQHYDDNETKLQRLYVWLFVAALALVVQVFMWLLELVVN